MAQMRRSARPKHPPLVRGDSIESTRETGERQKAAFFELADRLAAISDHAEQKRLKEELARMTFDER
jgi:hypothetical protein